MSINTREDANKYYQLVSELIDTYIDGHKIRPSRLGSYLKPGGERFNKFLERNKLSDIKGIQRVLKDVIDDRVSIESDGVLTFENFNHFQSDEFKTQSMSQCLYKGIDKTNLSQEKVLADYFDTNLSLINIVDADKHLFSIEDWEGSDTSVIIYSLEELDAIKQNLVDFFVSDITSRQLEVGKIDFKLGDVVEKESLEENIKSKLKESELVRVICDILGTNWEFESKEGSHFLWVKLD